MPDATIQGLEGCALIEIGHGDSLPGVAQVLGEALDTLGDSLGMVEEDDFAH
jgi:hypothetical protein